MTRDEVSFGTLECGEIRERFQGPLVKSEKESKFRLG
jgi:hypothetical protein